MKSIYFISIFTITFFFSCENDDNTKLEELDYEFLEFTQCSPCFEFRNKEFVIKDSESYQNLQDSINSCYFTYCENIHFPEIDFTEYSLIGKYTGVGACNTEYDRKFILDPSNSTYIYKIVIEYSGACDSKRESMNWIKVSKLNNTYSVTFQLDYINKDE